MSISSPRAQRLQTAVINGDKPLGQRKLASFVAVAALIVSATFAGESQASNWFSQSVNSSATHYNSSQALRGGDVNEGVIEAIQVVSIKDKRSVGTGTMIGGAVGGALGYTVTHNNHNSRVRTLGTLLGTTLGAGTGAAIQNIGSNHPGLRIIVRTTDARGHVQHKSFVQDDDQRGIAVGATVAIVRDGGQNRVVPIDSGLANRIANDERSSIRDRADAVRYENDDARYGRSDDRTRYERDDGYSANTGSAENTQVIQQVIRRYRP